MLVQLIVDPDACIGSGECVALDPEAIELDAQGIAYVILPELDEERARMLCDACPVGAISIAGS
jgi:ferredoxin